MKDWLFCLYGIFMVSGRSLHLLPLILMLLLFWLTAPCWLFLIQDRFLPVFLQGSFYIEISEYSQISTFASVPAACTVPMLLLTGFRCIICQKNPFIPASIGLSLYLRFPLCSCTCP